MSFDLFGPTKKRDIRVGYISTDRGYIKGITVLEANKYAFKNPGTVFILETRDSTRYLNINDVNKLTPQDVIPSNTSGDGTCSGIVGLNPKVINNNPPPPGGGKPNTTDPRTVLPRGPVGVLPPGTSTIGDGTDGTGTGTPGGGGTGGSDGTGGTGTGTGTPGGGTVGVGTLSGGTQTGITTNGGGTGPIVVISGGGGVGAKAVPVVGDDGGVLDIKLIAGGFGYKSAPRVTVIDPNRRGSGVVAAATVGFDTTPTLLTYTDEDDFEEYDFDPANGNPDLSGYGERVGVNGESLGSWDPTLYASLEEDPIGIQIARYQAFLRELKNPWWSTRKELPLTVAFGDKKDRVVHQVQHPAWGGEKGLSTDLESVEFEVYGQGTLGNRSIVYEFTAQDGSHKFQIRGVNADEKTRTDVIKVKANTTYDVKSSVMTGANARSELIEQGLLEKGGKNPGENRKFQETQRSSIIFGDIIGSLNDNDDVQINAKRGKFKASNRRNISINPSDKLKEKFKDEPNRFKRATFDLTYRLNKPGATTRNITPSFMNNYAISPVPPSNVKGSDFAGRWCTFEWEEDFPHTGEYVFRGMADNIGRMFVDNDLIMRASHFRGDPLPSNVVKKTIEGGVHRIKVDLYNTPQIVKETIVNNKTKDQKEKVPVEFEVYGQGTIPNTAINMVFTSEDGSHSFTFKPEEGRGNTYDYKRTVRVLPNTQYKVQAVATGKFEPKKQEYPIQFNGLNRSNNPIEVSGKNANNQNNTLKFRDGHGADNNAKFTIVSTSPGVSAKFSDDGKRLLTKGKGDVTLRLRWDDNPRIAGVAVRSIKIGGVTWKQSGEKGQETKTLSLSKGSIIDLVPEQGTLKRDGFKKSKKKGAKESRIRSNVIFADIIGSANDNDDMQIRCSEGIFVPTNKRNKVQGTSGQGTQKRNTWDLTFTVNAKPTLKPGGDSGTNVTEIFSTGNYIDKADRKLWRTNLYNNATFLNEQGVSPFNTIQIPRNNDYAGTHVIRWEHITFPADGNYQIEVEVDDRVKLFIGNRSGNGAMEIGNGLRSVEEGGDEVIIEKNGFVGDSNRSTGKSTYTRFFKKGQYRMRAELYQKPGGVYGFSGSKSYGQNDGSNLTARFVGSGNNIFLEVKGTGTATVNLSLKMDDNPNIKGDSCKSIRIGDVELKRTRTGVGGRGRSAGKLKEKELITGSGTFTGGERYRVVISGASAGAGAPRVTNNTVELLDTGGNDTNGTLKIARITNRQGATIRGLNPMALAIRIRADVTETVRISPRSWNDNPMGAAFTIDAPLPPIPVSPRPISEGRCPENPTWTTRFSGGSESWWPVTHKFSDGSRSWSKFMNRFAISPIPPLATESTDGGGIVYSNSWTINVPHSGFYALKGTVDNGGRILVDGTERIRGGYFAGAVFAEPADGSVGKLAGFRTVSPPLHKFYLEEGQHVITVEVENQKTTKQRKVEKKIFSTKDWREKKVTPDRVPVKFDVYGQGTIPNTAINFVFTSEDGKDSFTFKPQEGRGNKYNYSREVSVLPGVNYKVESVATGKFESKKQEYVIKFDGLNRANNPIEVSGKNSTNQNDTLKLRDGHGGDTNAKFTIISTSPGVTAKFSDDGKKLLTRGQGDVTIRLKWDDRPSIAGVAVKRITIGGKTWKQNGTKGEHIQTISTTRGSVDLVPEQGTLKRGSFGKSKNEGAKESGNSSDVIFADIIGSANDNDDLQIRASVGEFTPSNKRKGIRGVSGQGLQKRNTYDLTFRVAGNNTTKVESGGVNYEGPQLFVIRSGSAVKVWSKFMQTHAVSPFIPPIDQDNAAIVGDRTYIWKNVNFFESGRYKFLFQSDDGATLFINGNEVAKSRSFVGNPVPTYAEISAGRYEIKVVCNNINLNPNILARNNPTGFALKVLKDVVISEKSYSWTTNPVGISAMLIPPPCPKVIVGKGIVTDIIVRDPGNGMPPPTGGGVPTITTVKDVDPTLPGINYDPDDLALIDGIPTTIEVDNFGRVTRVNVPTIITTTTPVVEIPSLTGIGFRGTPIMETTIVPEDVFEDIIQVTDLVGLKQTGYVNGKPYYGSVFTKDGQLFAGVYETTGDLIPVYATLQESIDNRITTRPSAILRTGTDVSSNDPRLNIPGTPENLI